MSLAARVLDRLICWYGRVISPAFPRRCRYYPTCSAYALTAIRRFGAARGLLLAALRLLRCQPWNRGGIDDVPRVFSPFYRFPWSRAHGSASDAPASDVSRDGVSRETDEA